MKEKDIKVLLQFILIYTFSFYKASFTVYKTEKNNIKLKKKKSKKLLTSILRYLLIQPLLVCKLELISNGPFSLRRKERE